MRHAACLALALVALLPAVATAQDVADLSGLWNVNQGNTKHRPGSARFYEKAGTPQRHTYRVAFVTHVGTELKKADLRAVWNGTTLVVGAGTVNGLIDVIGGTASSSTKAAKYALSKVDSFDLEQLVLSSGSVDELDLPRQLRRTTGPDAVAPAEWDPSEEVLWGYRDEFRVSRIYAAAIKATSAEDVTHRFYVTSAAARAQLEYEFAEAEAPMARVKFADKKFQTVWMRDFGPITLKLHADGKRIVGDMGYFPDRPKDDFVPEQYARSRHWARRDVESLMLEGGNFISDGRGRIFTTTRALEANPSQNHIEDRLRDLGAREVVMFERMPEPEGTGHIDMFAKLVDEKTVLVGRCDDSTKFGAVLDRNAARFEQLGYKVIRLLMANGPKLMTYTNSLFVGRTVLVPTYGNATRDAAALQVYRDLGWNPVGIDARAVIKANGAIHCISMQIPR